MALSSFEQRWAATVARSFVPRGVLAGLTDGADAGALIKADDDAGPWHAALLLRFGLWLVWLAPLWHQGRLRTFGGLGEDERESLLEALLHHRAYAIRQAVNYVKMIACSVLLGDIGVLTLLGAYKLGPPRRAAP